METLRDELKRHAAGIDWPALGRFLDSEAALACFADFEHADVRARHLRRKHRRITLGGAFAGTAALALGLFQTSYPAEADRMNLWRWEAGLALIAALLVVWGMLAHFHENWLRERITAERLRLCVFGVVADRSFWKTGVAPEDWSKLEEGGLETFARSGDMPKVSRPLPGDDAPAPEPVARFYLRARFETQLAYFARKEAAERRRYMDDPGLVQLVFFVSVVLVFIHVVAHWAFTLAPQHEFHEASNLFLFLSALVPVAFIGFRSWRSANEFARNADRALAKHALLEKFRAAAESSNDAWSLFTAMRLTEAMLEEEQREWLRLMLEADWTP